MRNEPAAAEVLSAIMALAVSLSFFYLTYEFPRLRGDPGGGALWPRIMALGTAAACVSLLVVRGVSRWKSRPAAPSAPLRERLYWMGVGRTFWIIAASIIYPIAITTIGFIAATLCFAMLLMRILGATWLATAWYPPLVTAGIYVFFVTFLDAIVPRGVLIEAVLR